MLTVEGGPASPKRSARVLPFLEREPMLHGIAASVLRAGEPADLAVAVDGTGDVVAVGLRTEVKYLISRAREAGAPAALAADALGRGVPLTAWMGPAPEVRDFTAAWAERTGRRVHCAVRLRIYSLNAPPAEPAVAGRSRPAGPADLPTLASWRAAFSAETGTARPGEDHAAAAAAAMAAGRLRVWEHGAAAVSMAQASAPAPGPARLSLVYTPPEYRGRGYGSACVAALSAELLAAGRPSCYLYADLANPISNSIYQRIGYRAVADVEDWRPLPG